MNQFPRFSEKLKISAFRDITSFLLESDQTGNPQDYQLKYVQNAQEAHDDLIQDRVDVVFMSYDDTLTVALKEGCSGIRAIFPVHGGILDFCGELNPPLTGKIVGIDTESGYARALRYCLKKRFSNPAEYQQIIWKMSGATNKRYEKLISGEIHATLLNPPFSCDPQIKQIFRTSELIGPYLGVIAHVKNDWLGVSKNREKLLFLRETFQKTLTQMKKEPENTIKRLQDFYGITPNTAQKTYKRLWDTDGLIETMKFSPDALSSVEKLFSSQTGISVPIERGWIHHWD